MTAQIINHTALTKRLHLEERVADARREMKFCEERYAALFGRTSLPEEFYPELSCYGSVEIAEEKAWEALEDARAELARLETEAQGGAA